MYDRRVLYCLRLPRLTRKVKLHPSCLLHYYAAAQAGAPVQKLQTMYVRNMVRRTDVKAPPEIEQNSVSLKHDVQLFYHYSHRLIPHSLLLQSSLQTLQNLENVSVAKGTNDETGLTSSSILASAMSISLPLPPAIFCASAICDRTASALKSSKA